MVLQLRASFLQNPRLGWSILPNGVKLAGKVERVNVEELIWIERGSAAAYNRLLDAFQEVVSASLIAGQILNPFDQERLAAEASSLDFKNPPPGMYG